MSTPWILLLIAIVFAVVTGANEGGAIATMGFQLPLLRPFAAVLVLTAAVMAAPFILGSGVADTLAHSVIDVQTSASRTAFLLGLCASVLVVLVLTYLRLPTSLNLAMVGGLAGAGVGFGLPVSWSGVGQVLLFCALAPVAGALVGSCLVRVFRQLWRGPRIAATMRWAGLTGYLSQALAYGANGGQKVIAVFGVCGAAGGATMQSDAGTTALIGSCFLCGSVLTMRRLNGRLGRDLAVVGPVQRVSAGFASSSAVFASMAAGMPVSLTQVIASAFVGAGATDSRRRVKWQAVSRLVAAWFITLPASVALAMAVAWTMRGHA